MAKTDTLQSVNSSIGQPGRHTRRGWQDWLWRVLIWDSTHDSGQPPKASQTPNLSVLQAGSPDESLDSLTHELDAEQECRFFDLMVRSQANVDLLVTQRNKVVCALEATIQKQIITKGIIQDQMDAVIESRQRIGLGSL